MTACRIEREEEGGRTILRVSGTFDRASAFAVREELSRGRPREVVIDFSQVRDFADLGVATLAYGIAGTDRRVSMRGLRTHQLRIFRYFGVEADPTTAPAGDEAAART